MKINAINSGAISMIYNVYQKFNRQIQQTESLENISQVNRQLAAEVGKTKPSIDGSNQHILEPNNVQEGKNLWSGNHIDNYV